MLIDRYIIVVVGKENRFYNKVDVGRLNLVNFFLQEAPN